MKIFPISSNFNIRSEFKYSKIYNRNKKASPVRTLLGKIGDADELAEAAVQTKSKMYNSSQADNVRLFSHITE